MKWQETQVVAAMLLALMSTGFAQTRAIPGPIEAQVLTEMYNDGDTFWIRAEVWPGMIAEQKVRVRGLDAPELSDNCNNKIGQRAADRTKALIGERVRLVSVDHDKYGERVVADVILSNGDNLADILIREELGRADDDKAERPWCE